MFSASSILVVATVLGHAVLCDTVIGLKGHKPQEGAYPNGKIPKIMSRPIHNPPSKILRRPRIPKQMISDKYTYGGDECDYGAINYNGWCYSTMCRDPNPNYYTAFEQCTDGGGSLISIHDEAENTLIKERFANQFIGLEYDKESKTFSWTDGTPFDYSSLSSTFVAYGDYFGYCATVNQDGVWVNAECNTGIECFSCKKRPYVNPSSSCSNITQSYVAGTEFTSVQNPGHPNMYHFYHSGKCYYHVVTSPNYHIQAGLGWYISYSSWDHFSFYEGDTEDPNHLLGTADEDTWYGAGGVTHFTTKTRSSMLIVFSTDATNDGDWILDFKAVN